MIPQPSSARIFLACGATDMRKGFDGLRFRQMKLLQKFVSVHASRPNHFSRERHLVDRQTYRERRSAALPEWQSSCS